MPKINYANLVQGIGKAVGTISDVHAKESAKQVLQSPEATPVQKAIAWETYAGGGGLKAYETLLKEQALQKEETQNSQVNSFLDNPDRMPTNVGTRAQAGALPEVGTYISPVAMANNLAPSKEEYGPEEEPYGQQLPNEPITPAMQALQDTRQQQNAPGEEPIEQGGLRQEKPRTFRDLTADELQAALGKTTHQPTIRRIQARLKELDTQDKNKGKAEAAKIKKQGDREKEDRTEIREYAAPYQNLEKFDKGVKDMEQAAEIILNSDEFSFDETNIRTFIAGLAQDKDKESLAEMFKTPAQQKMFNLMYDSLNTKGLGGSNPSTKEVLLSMSRQPSPYKGKAANVFIVQNMLDFAKREREKAQAITEIRGEYPDITAPELYKMVNQRVSAYGKEIEKESQFRVNIANAQDMVKKNPPLPGMVVMMDPNGKMRQVPANQAQQLQAEGKVLIK